MSSAASWLTRLQSKGWRITPARRALFEILLKHHKPMSVAAILEAMTNKGLSPNKTTIYREFERLKEEGVLREVLIDGKTQYVELVNEEDHHHHLICTMCKRVEDFDPTPEVERKIDELTALVGRKIQFGEVSHSVDFFGVCTKCKGRS